MSLAEAPVFEDAAQAAFDFPTWAARERAAIEAELDRLLPAESPANLHLPMRYAVMGGGKRIRPLLTLAAAQAAGGRRETAMVAGCALEMIHAYSLVHDDLPCMDDDVLRRGRPTVHVAFGEAVALLAGDALQSLAFDALTRSEVPESMQGTMCGILARASGHAGMAGGQAVDIVHVGDALDLGTLTDMHRRKTGCLLQASVSMGAASASLSIDDRRALDVYGQAVGLAFQIVDDVLDASQDSETLGKTAGKDAAMNKPTYVTLMGLDASRQQALHQLELAELALDGSRLADTRCLKALAREIVWRIR
jgi:farnesyl diphosphate synthase